MPLVVLAQESFSAGETSSSFGWAVGLVVLVAVLLSLPFLWGRGKWRWVAAALALLLVGQAALLSDDSVRQRYASVGEALLSVVLLTAIGLIPPGLLLLWRRTRRFAVAWAGLVVVSALAIANYMSTVIASIGYLLLLIALWPRWRLLQAAPRGREAAPVVPSRGVLQVQPWPLDGRTGSLSPRRGERGYSLASALAGVACLVVAFGLAAALISGTSAAVHRADHLAVATDLLESVRERALLGAGPDDLARQAAAKLPRGQATLRRAPAGGGLVRITATATWQEPTGQAGRATLEWLALERSR